MNDMRCLKSVGYTLMEIVVVITIIAVGATFFFVKFEDGIERTRAGGAIKVLQALREAQESFSLENGDYTSTITNLGVSIPPTLYFDAPQVSSSDATALASVARNSSNFNLGTAYTLKISQTGAVTCSGSAYCTRLGF